MLPIVKSVYKFPDLSLAFVSICERLRLLEDPESVPFHQRYETTNDDSVRDAIGNGAFSRSSYSMAHENHAKSSYHVLW